MTEVIDECILCEAKKVQRIPSLSFTTVEKNGSGNLVKEYIEETRASVLREKKKLKEDYNG
jgi:hypothetical protein